MKIFAGLALSLGLVTCVYLSGCSGSSSSSPTPTPTASPTVTSISPTSVDAGSGPLTLTVNGTGFIKTTTVQVGGIADATSYLNGTQVTATISASQLASGSQLSIIALNGTASSGSSQAVNLQVTNPVPTITQLSPATLAAGMTSPVLSLTGTGYVPATVVNVNGSARTTTFVSGTQVNVALTAADVATAGSLALTAVNPAPGGGTSASSTAAIVNPAPGARTTLTPQVILTGTTTPATITVTGTNFVPTSIIQINGSAQTTTYVSATQLTFQLAAALQATSQLVSVTVVNPTPGGGMSLPAQLEILSKTPTPVIAQVNPSQFVVGSGSTSITVSGSNLVTQLSLGQLILTSTVLWNGTPLSTLDFYSNGSSNVYISAQVPASLLTSLGTASITVSSLTSTPATSNALPVSITNPPPPTLTSISPSAGPINSATPVTLYGTGFTNQSTVALNGIDIPAAYVDSGQLTATIPASSIALPGNIGFTVTTPAPGGGTSAPLPFTAFIGIANNSMVYNPVNGLFYLSVPSSAGAPYGNSIVSVDPETGALGTPIPVGSEPDKLAITTDGHYLWVGLDGASAVRKVDLIAGAAGLQFSLGGNGGIYDNPPTVLALAALPGASDSVVVSTSGGYPSQPLAIYDSGVIRGSNPTNYQTNTTYALQVNSAKGEIYAAGQGSYTVYTYSASGLTQMSTASNGNYANYGNDDLQVTGERTYTDYGTVYDAEAGALLGTFYAAGTNPAGGPTVADTTLGKAFILDSSQNSYGNYDQIQIFNTSDFTSAGAAIPVSILPAASSPYSSSSSHLTRWGTNGLAFQNTLGVYSLRSNLVKNLSTVSTDLEVTLTPSGTNTTGTNTTYTATVTNLGPAAATNIALTAQSPSTAVLISAKSAAGLCSISPGVTCNLGGLASGAKATVTIVMMQTTAGSATTTVQVSGSETDPVLSNNQATSTLTITGDAYSIAPSLISILPSAIQSGSGDTVITVTGSGFNSGSTVELGGSALVTGFTSSSTLTATVPADTLASMGWAPITVSTPAPGGGTSTALPLTIYQVLTVGLNRILYEPFSTKIYASVGSGSASIQGNSIAAITPETGAIGIPVYVGSQPTKMAVSDDGNILYSLLGGANSVARFNLQTQKTEFTFSPSSANCCSTTPGYRDIAVQPGSENTVAVDFGYTGGMALIDVNPTAKTAAIRGSVTGIYTGTSLQFYDPQTLYLFNSDTWQTLDKYPITSSGFGYGLTIQSSTLSHFGSFKLHGKIGFSVAGGVADITTSPATQLGVFNLTSGYSYAGPGNVAPDPSVGRVFFGVNSGVDNYSGAIDSIAAYNSVTYMPAESLPLNFAAIEGNSSFSMPDLIRWGQDGLAALTSSGHLYIMRGPVVVPQLLNHNSAASLTSSSMTSIARGTGNTMLTLTGSNFVPGVAATWNGSYRTTTMVDATHMTVAIPASDLASAGSGSLVATNPGASASKALTVTVN
jgi:hypothetical protein